MSNVEEPVEYLDKFVLDYIWYKAGRSQREREREGERENCAKVWNLQ